MVNLNVTIGSDSAEFAAIAHDLQGNILRAHKRRHADHIFLQFGEPTLGRSFIGTVVAPRVTSAARQTADFEAGKDFVSFGLAAAAFEVLGIQPPSSESAFTEGMAGRSNRLVDPPVESWQDELQGPWHAVLIVANDDRDALEISRKALVADMTAHDIDSWVEPGALLKDREEEHFGFKDGISQTILLSNGNSVAGRAWNPLFPLSQALVVDTAGDHGHNSLGSFMVIRKLRQNVEDFDTRFPTDTQAHRVIGRARDGTPLLARNAKGGRDRNNFDFANDPGGAACPLHSHIRKTNPRLDDRHRATLFVRRGIPYGTEGRGERGLIFIAYNSSLERQFETMQRRWINDENFPTRGAGFDALLTTGLVEMRGGEYFFVPCISALRKFSQADNENRAPENAPMRQSRHTLGEHMSTVPEPIGLGQGPITPEGFFSDLIAALRMPENVARYVAMASEASLEPLSIRANELVFEYLDSIGLDHRVSQMEEPTRTHLVEALRVMGIRLRRTAALSLNPTPDDPRSLLFEQILTSFESSETW